MSSSLPALLDIGDGCGWVERITDRTELGQSDCSDDVAYELVSSVNGRSFYACIEHAAATRAKQPQWIATIRTYR